MNSKAIPLRKIKIHTRQMPNLSWRGLLGRRRKLKKAVQRRFAASEKLRRAFKVKGRIDVAKVDISLKRQDDGEAGHCTAEIWSVTTQLSPEPFLLKECVPLKDVTLTSGKIMIDPLLGLSLPVKQQLREELQEMIGSPFSFALDQAFIEEGEIKIVAVETKSASSQKFRGPFCEKSRQGFFHYQELYTETTEDLVGVLLSNGVNIFLSKPIRISCERTNESRVPA